MITFKTFLEQKSNGVSLRDIKRDCRLFLSETKSPLYRGVGSAPDNIRFNDHPTARRPKDSSPMWNQMFNYASAKLFGVENIRRKSIFASGSITQARTYGDVVLIMLAGNYKCLSSSVINDTYNDLNFDEGLDLKFEKVLKFSSDEYPYLSETALWDILSEIRAPLDDEMDFTNEMIESFERAKKNFTKINVSAVERNSSKLYKTILQHCIEMLKEKDIRQMNIEKAISTKNEIAIYESAGHYDVPFWVIKQQIDEGIITSSTDKGKAAIAEILKIAETTTAIYNSGFPGLAFFDNLKILISES